VSRPDLECGSDRFAPGLDAVVTLGGDGSILRAVELVGESGVPILGVNFGRMAYLTEVAPSDARSAIDRVLAGDHDVEERMLLTVEFGETAVRTGRLEVAVTVRNLAGHKFPTAYPSRRAWLRVTVTDAGGRPVFQSGALTPEGRVIGDDHDDSGSRYEPHHTTIDSPGQVQVYQGVMVDGDGMVTTGLMSAERWVKDNRILPRGFDSGRADPRVLPVGAAASDPDFEPGSDVVRYSVAVDPATGPFTVEAELWFQPIAYRWAENLAPYGAPETRRFVRYYREMASGSALMLARDSRVVR